MKPYKSFFEEQAKQDVKEAFSWYNIKGTTLGKRFLSSVRKRIHEIRANPYIVQLRYNETRTALIEIFPYMIHFYIDENIKTIIAVLHTSRNTDSWLKKD